MTEIDDALANVAVWECRVGSWLGGRFLGLVPFTSGSITWSKSRDVMGSLELEVPPMVDGVSWVPGNDPQHPLAKFGQELTVDITVTDPVSGLSEDFQMGRFVIQDWEETDDVQVSAQSMMKRVEDDRFLAPLSTRKNALLAVEARRLVTASLGVRIDPDLPVRACPDMSWDESRIDSVNEVADAWPARVRESRDGTIQFLAPLPEIPEPELRLTDGEGGTLVSAPTSDSREGIYNVVVARGQETTTDGTPSFQAVARQTVGPLSVDGPYGVVPRFFSSPLITRQSMANASARTMLRSSIVSAAVIKGTCAPDPRFWIDAPMSIVKNKGGAQEQTITGWCSGFTLDLLAKSDMTFEMEAA